MKKEQLTLSRIVDLHNGVELVGELANLSGTATYRIGRLGDFCAPVVKKVRKAQEKVLSEIKERQDPLLDELSKVENKTSPEAQALAKQIQALNLEFTEAVEKLLDEKEEITIPEFKLEMFIAEEDFVRVETVVEKDSEGKEVPKKIQVKYKKGQSLVPVRFFKPLGEIIQE